MSFLAPEILTRIYSRASVHDAENSFPQDDLRDLTDAGYLTAFVPRDYGGAGLSLAEICREQTALAKASPGTALGINMHHIIVGLGRHMIAQDHEGGKEILRLAGNGDLFGFGISEPANDLVLFGSTTEAKPDDDGGYSFYGTKIFTSLAPVWTKLLTFGRDDSGSESMSVFAILDRNRGGFTIVDDWYTLGMRATQSNTTLLQGAYAPAEHVLARVTPGPSFHPVVFGIFANFELLLAATYTGIGQRAVELAVETVKQRKSVRMGTTYSNDPDIRWRIADAAIIMDGIYPQIDALAHDFENGVDRGAAWLPQLSAVKHRAVEAAKEAVEQAIRASGGSSYYMSKELSRLYRDVLAGLFQPSDAESLHTAWASLLLGPIESPDQRK
ncbi:MAG: acyl-CoA dehydrogenase family protein [Actinomycetaceae bacterium]|nr:acyl-CoA dehydrogenase family protein [Actinomycetaceae bacterium]